MLNYIPRGKQLCILLYALLLTINLTGQTGGPLDSIGTPLEEVVISATRLPTPAAEAGAAVIVLGGKDLTRSQPRSMAEALIGQPALWMQKTNHGGGSPFLRGLTGNQVLLLYDGIRLNNSTYRYGPNQYFNTVDPFAIDRVEVIPGGGSVLYGSDALGGTINLISAPLLFPSEKDSTAVKGRLVGRVRSRDMERTLRTDLRIAGKQLAIGGGISLRDFGDLYAGEALGKLTATGYRERAADLKAGWKTGARSRLLLSYNGLIQTGVGRYDQVVQRGYRRYDFDPQERQLVYLRWETQPARAWVKQLELTAAGQYSREIRLKQKNDSPLLRREEDRVRTFSSSAIASLKFSPLWTATTGVEFYHDLVDSKAGDYHTESGENTHLRGLYPAKATVLNSAVFTRHRLQLGQWRLNAGMRYNPLRIKFQDGTFGKTDLRPSALAWDVAVAYNYATTNSLRFSAGSGFRAPNVNDLSSFGSFDFGVEVPSPGLLSERNLTTELAYQDRSSRLHWRVSLFYNRLYNLIERERSSFLGTDTFEGQDVYAKINRGKAEVLGGEAALNFIVNTSWRFLNSLSYTRGEAEGEPLRRIPPINGCTELLYQPASGWFAGGALVWAGAQRRLSGGDIDDHRIAAGGTDGWAHGRISGGYRWQSLQVSILAENITGTNYRLHGSGVNGAGRHFSLEVGWGVR